MVGRAVARDQVGRSAAHAVEVSAPLEGADQGRMAREAKVVVAAEGDDAAAVDDGVGTLAPRENPPRAVQACLPQAL
jgi:hypothetical protein